MCVLPLCCDCLCLLLKLPRVGLQSVIVNILVVHVRTYFLIKLWGYQNCVEFSFCKRAMLMVCHAMTHTEIVSFNF